jgi:undecaprenyl-diphosphatase
VAPTTIADQVDAHPAVADALADAEAPAAPAAGVALSAAVIGIVVAVAAFGVVAAMIDTNTGLARWDATFAQFGADHASERSTAVLRAVSQLGGTPGVVTLVLVVAVFAAVRIRRPSAVAFVLLCGLGHFALSNAIKLLVARERPDILHLTGFAGTSFPSGHSTAAAAAWLGCALVVSRGLDPRRRAIVMAGAASVAGAVAASRVLLGVHWFTDVLAGVTHGWMWFAVCSVIFGGTTLRFGAPVEQAEATAVAAGAGSRSPAL